MELLEIDDTRVIHLVQVRRTSGQLYLPEVAAKIVDRYSFLKAPSADDFIRRPDYFEFAIGKFAETQIQHLKIYNDGLIVDAKSNSKILERFVDDLLNWVQEEFGVEPIPYVNVERHHESYLVVKSSKDLSKIIGDLEVICNEINSLLTNENFAARKFKATGFVLDVDPADKGSVRQELRFVLDRRVGVPFSKDVFFSQAPLPTDSHMALLKRIESLAR